jgi:hypothetical protein
MTFYVGRGQGDRVFRHAAGIEREGPNEDATSSKLDVIRKIIEDGFTVDHIIHRHGMNEDTAKEVEAALIDAYPGLTNIQPGHEKLRGAKHALQIRRLYEPEVAKFTHKVIWFKVDTTLKKSPTKPIIDAVRYAWKIDKKKARKAKYVLAVKNGIIIDAFIAEDWRPATPENFPGFPRTDPKRLGFSAREAPDEVKAIYRQKRLPPLRRGNRKEFGYEPKALWR